MITFFKNDLLLPTIVFVFLSAGCKNPVHLLEKGNYDDAIALSVKKLSGKKKKKTDYVKVLEEAFSKATSADMRQIRALEREGREENWVKINQIHQRISRRQQLIEPLLPLYSKDGYKADFNFVKIEDLEIQSKEKAAEYYYNEGKRLLAEGERGDKNAARKAYEHFEKISRYYKRYKDEENLMKRAKELGTVYILFSI